MLAHAKPKSIFPLPASPRAGAKPVRSESTGTLRSAPLRFPHCRTSAPPARIPAIDFDEIFRTYHRSVYSKCFRILRNHGEAEDVVQEVFLQLLRKADTFRGESKFSTWLHRLTINTVLMRLRKLRRQELRTARLDDSTGEEEGNLAGSETATPWQAPGTITAERVGLRLAISQLPEGYQRVFSLHDVEGYTHEEISKVLGISLGTSKSQLHKARLRLRVLLQFGVKEESPNAFAPEVSICSSEKILDQARA